MRRFIVPELTVVDGVAVLGDEFYRHAVTVLRLGPGATVELADGTGRRCRGAITAVTDGTVTVQVTEETVTDGTADGPRITLYQGLAKPDKLELVLQKATELGVHRIVIFPAERSVTRLDRERGAERVKRWQKIVLEASRQCGRSAVPEVALAGSLAAALAEAVDDVRLLLWEDEAETSLRTILAPLPPPDTAAFIVGPEGGLSPAEAAAARQAGFASVTLGTRILRTETASLALLAILQYLWGDLG